MQEAKRAQELFTQGSGKAVETMTLWADANQRVLRQLTELWAAAAKESVRLYADMQQMGLEMLRGFPTRVQHEAPPDADDAIVIPLAMPLIAGPGAITTVITLTTQAPGLRGQMHAFVAVAVTTWPPAAGNSGIVALPLAFVATAVAPRKFCPSPLPEGSQAVLPKN